MALTIQDLLKIRPPMTRKQAVFNVEALKRETPLDAQKKLLEMALGGLANLSPEARDIYAVRLQELS